MWIHSMAMVVAASSCFRGSGTRSTERTTRVPLPGKADVDVDAGADAGADVGSIHRNGNGSFIVLSWLMDETQSADGMSDIARGSGVHTG